MKRNALLLAISITTLTACKKNSDNNNNDTIGGTAIWSTTFTAPSISKYLAANTNPADSITIQSKDGGTIENDSVSVDIPENAFSKADGTPYNGSVVIKMQTIRKVQDMIYSGITTLAGNKILNSGGMINLAAYDNTHTPLVLAAGVSLAARFPRVPANFGIAQVFKGTIINNASNTINWSLYGNNPNGGAASPYVAFTQDGATDVFGISDLLTWTNLDSYVAETGAYTDLTLNVPAAYSNSNTVCCFKYAGTNSCTYLPGNATIKAFSTKGSPYQVITGKGAKVFALAEKDGVKYYQALSINAIGTDQVLTFNNMAAIQDYDLKLILSQF